MIPYSSVQLFKCFQLKWLPFFRFYVGSFKLEVLKCDVFKININVLTCVTYGYCLVKYHRFRSLNSPSILTVWIEDFKTSCI